MGTKGSANRVRNHRAYWDSPLWKPRNIFPRIVEPIRSHKIDIPNGESAQVRDAGALNILADLSGLKDEKLIIKRDERPQKAGWAPGYYMNTCCFCNFTFIGDKRAVNCADCVYEEDFIPMLERMSEAERKEFKEGMDKLKKEFQNRHNEADDGK